MALRTKTIAALTALTFLFAWCVWIEAPRIEAELKVRAVAELDRFAWAEVEVNGRRVAVSGAPSQGDWALARRRLQGVDGVGRIVRVEQLGEETQH